MLRNFYQIRLWTTPLRHSSPVGFKGRLLPYRKAQAVLRFLKARGREGYLAKFRVRLS